jgi:hypothetical protein
MNLGAAYANLTTSQLRAMTDAAKADYKRQIEHLTLRLAVETTALRKAMAIKSATLMAELQAQKNANAVLQRELDAVHDLLAQANITITEQERRLTAHNAVVGLEKKLSIARRAAS